MNCEHGGVQQGRRGRCQRWRGLTGAEDGDLEPGVQTKQVWGTGRDRGGWQDLMRKGARRRQQDGDGGDDDDDDDDVGGGGAHACLAIIFMSVHVTATAWSASLLSDGARGIGGA